MNSRIPTKSAFFLVVLFLGCDQPAQEQVSAPSERQVISTDAAPPAIGPYSQAILAGDMLFWPAR